MKIIGRLTDIINSNVNSALDKIEDPEKMISLMISQMEDTLREAKSSREETLANLKRNENMVKELLEAENRWNKRADLAVNKNLDDLAREALIEKKKATSKIKAMESEHERILKISQDQDVQVEKLTDKLQEMKDRKNELVIRARSAKEKSKVEKIVHEVDSSDFIQKFHEFENKIEKMEASAEMVNYGKNTSVGQKFSDLERDEEIEAELNAMKEKKASTKKKTN